MATEDHLFTGFQNVALTAVSEVQSTNLANVVSEAQRVQEKRSLVWEILDGELNDAACDDDFTFDEAILDANQDVRGEALWQRMEREEEEFFRDPNQINEVFGLDTNVSKDGMDMLDKDDDTLTNVLQRLGEYQMLNMSCFILIIFMNLASSGNFDPSAILQGIASKSSRANDWFPYPNKTVSEIILFYNFIEAYRRESFKTLILDILDNLPRLRLSDTLLKMILWAMDQCGAQHVPSFSSFRALQDTLRLDSSQTTVEFKSCLGNTFYMNDIRPLVAKVN